MIWPLIYVLLAFFGLGVLLAKKELNFSNATASCIVWFILYMGNFFDPIIKAF